MSEKRHFHRVKFAVKTDIEVNGITAGASLVDISLKGALVEFFNEYEPELGSLCRLTIRLNHAEAGLSFAGEVVHVDDGLVGIKITRIDIDSMIHLRRLVELNSADAEQVRSELAELACFGNEQKPGGR